MAELQGDLSTLGGVAGAKKVSGNREYIFAYVPASTPAGTPLYLSFDGDEETNPKGLAPVTSTTVYQTVVFTTVAQVLAGYQWCQVKGDAIILVDGGTADVAKDDFLEVLNAGTALVYDATTKGTGSLAIAQEAYTSGTNALKHVYLLGERVFVQAA